MATGSIGVLSEAAHSRLDLLAAVTFFAVRESGRPADDEHAYGHGKVENLAALFGTGLSAAAAREQVVEAERTLRVALPQIERILVRFGTGEA